EKTSRRSRSGRRAGPAPAPAQSAAWAPPAETRAAAAASPGYRRAGLCAALSGPSCAAWPCRPAPPAGAPCRSRPRPGLPGWAGC
nr:hypothetical protein [Tanacetum cinerariifolium]